MCRCIWRRQKSEIHALPDLLCSCTTLQTGRLKVCPGIVRQVAPHLAQLIQLIRASCTKHAQRASGQLSHELAEWWRISQIGVPSIQCMESFCEQKPRADVAASEFK
jgi:hypothetical protein